MSHVLVADDDLDIARLVEFQLRFHGYDVTLAHDGNAALNQARAVRPDVILLDWMMPGMDGLECLNALKADEQLRSIPVILMTARAQQTDVTAGTQAGAAAYLVKPFQLETLLETLQGVLG